MTDDAAALKPIPHPPEKPVVGNLLDIKADTQVQGLMAMAREYGDIFSVNLGGVRLVVVSGTDLAAELCDETRFDKRVWAPLKNVRAFAGDGLFTANTYEPNWKKAHNILMPNFGLPAMQSYHPMMLEIAMQLIDRWQRSNPGDALDVSDHMTRLTLDTIGLCGFSYRFNSFYQERPHRFVRAMTRALSIAMDRSARPPLPRWLMPREEARFRRAVDRMNAQVDGIIAERRRAGEAGEEELKAAGDLLGHMLSGVDRETGEKLDDINIRYQILTFLIAGHETTSGLLSFALYYLVNHPEVLARAYDEVDRVLGPVASAGQSGPSYRQVTQLGYIRQILNESLRLWPTAPMFALFPLEGRTRIGGHYEVSKNDVIAILAPMLHRDPKVWGEDPERFDPDRFSPEREGDIPPHAFKPFGNGQRACIGRQFAMHEAMLALGLILQRFELVDHANYELVVKETLTLKPEGFSLQLRPRPANEAVAVPEVAAAAPDSSETAVAEAHGTALHVLFGSNMGTAEAMARRLAAEGQAAGFATRVAPLDEAVDRIDPSAVTLIVTASYNGTPPDNAIRFVEWLGGSPDLSGVRFAVFGCGHRDWSATYQEVPKQIEARLVELGAERLVERGEGDGGGDFEGDFEEWSRPLWPSLAETLDLDAAVVAAAQAGGPTFDQFDVDVVEEVKSNPFLESFGAQPMVVVENRELQGPNSDRSTRHVELALPAGAEYETGDHLGVVPQNDEALVRRVLDRFGFEPGTRVRIRLNPEALADGGVELPLETPLPVAQLLTEYVELQEVASRAELQVLLDSTECPPDRVALERLCAESEEARENYRVEVLEKRRSVLDVLESHPACELPFSRFLGMLPPLRPRYYSISSSPERLPKICSITVGVVAGPARSGRGSYRGVCSNHLAQRSRGSQVSAFVRPNPSSFRLPRAAQRPVILVGPGTGVAPFRGFLQERAAKRDRGEVLGEALLFYGCRHPDHDYLYRQELEQWRADGVVQLQVAFSRLESQLGDPVESPASAGAGSGVESPPSKVYVQHRMVEQADDVWRLLENDAVVYVCGDASQMEPGVRSALAAIYLEKTGADEVEAEAWIESLKQDRRYRVDVWASS